MGYGEFDRAVVAALGQTSSTGRKAWDEEGGFGARNPEGPGEDRREEVEENMEHFTTKIHVMSSQILVTIRIEAEVAGS